MTDGIRYQIVREDADARVTCTGYSDQPERYEFVEMAMAMAEREGRSYLGCFDTYNDGAHAASLAYGERIIYVQAINR